MNTYKGAEMMRKILDIQNVEFNFGKMTVKVKRCIWILVGEGDETSTTYKTDAIRCSYIGAGFSSVGSYFLGRKKLVSIPKKNPMIKVNKLITLEHLERSASQDLGSNYLAKKHSGFYMGRIIYTGTESGSWAGSISIPELGIDYHYYHCNIKGLDIPENNDFVEFKIDSDPYLLRGCGLHTITKLTELKAV